MSVVDFPSMREFAAQHYAAKVVAVGGDPAATALRVAVDAVVRVYDHFEPPPDGSWCLIVPPDNARRV